MPLAQLDHMQALDGALQSGFRSGMVHIIGLAGQALFGALLGGLGAGGVDVFGQFGRFRQHGQDLVVHIGKAAGDEHVVLLAAFSIAQIANLEGREQGDVMRQHAKLTHDAGAHGHIHLSADNTAWSMLPSM